VLFRSDLLDHIQIDDVDHRRNGLDVFMPSLLAYHAQHSVALLSLGILHIWP